MSKRNNITIITPLHSPIPFPASDTGAIRCPGRPISGLEEDSLLALLDYIADRQGSQAEALTRILCDRFNIPQLTALPAAAYDEAVRYLVDQAPECAVFA